MKERYRCAICGVVLREGRWIYSKRRNVRYCPVDKWEECSERSLRSKKREAVAA